MTNTARLRSSLAFTLRSQLLKILDGKWASGNQLKDDENWSTVMDNAKGYVKEFMAGKVEQRGGGESSEL